MVANLQGLDACMDACAGMDQCYQLAADMGGMGFIENNRALCMLSALINTHMVLAAKEHGLDRYFYASSACVYNADKQKNEDVVALREDNAYPTVPEDGDGWEKLFSERMCRHFREDFGLRLQRGQAEERGCGRVAGRRRLSGRARGRLRLGKALLGAHVPPLPGGFRPAYAHRPIPQRLRAASPHFSPGAVMIAEDFGPVYTRPVCTRGQKTREGTASAVCNRHDHWHRGQLLETMSSFDAEKRPGEKCGLEMP